MATRTFIGGSSNNTPGDPANWTPYGAPAPGDTLLMNSGTMNIGGGGLAGDTVILGKDQDSTKTINLFDGATLATTTATAETSTATINVNGHVTASLGQSYPSTAIYTVNLAAGSVLQGSYSTALEGTLTLNAAPSAMFENDSTSTNAGTTVVINADVVGAGTFTDSIAQSHLGFLEFGRSVAATQTINLASDQVRGRAALVLDRPSDFHALVNMLSAPGLIDFKNTQSDSYSFQNDVLSLILHGQVVQTLRLHNTAKFDPNAGTLPLVVEQHGTDVVVSAGQAAVYYGEPTLPQVSLPVPPQPPSVAIYDTTTGAAVADAFSQPYNGPVSGIQMQFVDLTTDSLNITATTPNYFIHTGSGNDAIQAAGGVNVLDGGTGSNFLTAGTGTDTFFVDARGAAADTWSSIAKFHAGDAATLWGVSPSSGALSWSDNGGATGYTGLTLHATAAGKPTASITLAGLSQADMAAGKVTASFGHDAASGSDYLYLHAN